MLLVPKVPVQSEIATTFPALGEAGNVIVNAALDVSAKYPTPLVAVKPVVTFVVFQDTSPVEPNPAAVPKLEIVSQSRSQ